MHEKLTSASCDQAVLVIQKGIMGVRQGTERTTHSGHTASRTRCRFGMSFVYVYIILFLHEFYMVESWTMKNSISLK